MRRDAAERVLDTTLRYGGGTFEHDGAEIYPENGFAVATQEESYFRISLENPDNAIDAIMATSSDYPSKYIGTWVFEGEIHIDPVIITYDREEALILARSYRQKAYFDFAKKESVYVHR